jgi:hypothetical protein
VGGDDVRHDAEQRPIAAADDIARTRRRNRASVGEERLPERPGDQFGACLRAAVGIAAGQSIVVAERSAGAVVLVDRF